MINTANHLRTIIAQIYPILEQLSESEISAKPSINQWSKIEILGHLIDSACNNQQKFVRMMQQKHLDFVGYEQNHWVKAQNYQNANWSELLAFWTNFNFHLANIIENTPSETLQNTICINGEGPFTLEFIMKDYNEHLKHHLHQILPDANIKSNFVNVYNNEN